MASRVCELGNLVKLHRIEVFRGYMDIKPYIAPKFCQQTIVTTWMAKDKITIDGLEYVIPLHRQHDSIPLAKFINNYVVFEKEIANLTTDSGESKKTFYHWDRDF